MKTRAAVLLLCFLPPGCMPGSMGVETTSPPAQSGKLSLARAHAHNDYDHERPLLDALDQGFASVEADVFSYPGLGRLCSRPLAQNEKAPGSPAPRV